MGEAAESEGRAFDAFDEVVDRFGGFVGVAVVVLVDDSCVPAARAAQLRGQSVSVRSLR